MCPIKPTVHIGHQAAYDQIVARSEHGHIDYRKNDQIRTMDIDTAFPLVLTANRVAYTCAPLDFDLCVVDDIGSVYFFDVPHPAIRREPQEAPRPADTPKRPNMRARINARRMFVNILRSGVAGDEAREKLTATCNRLRTAYGLPPVNDYWIQQAREEITRARSLSPNMPLDLESLATGMMIVALGMAVNDTQADS